MTDSRAKQDSPLGEKDDVQPLFWKTKSPDRMTTAEWESLCDGCGKCCLFVLKDTITEQAFYTRVACEFMDLTSCRCREYEHRHKKQARCVILKPSNLDGMDCLPSTCAYKRIAKGQDLEWWHPLISGNPATVHLAGVSILGKAVSGIGIPTDQLINYIIRDDEWNR
jgi:uncharacterized cysteine cluster protein YcgN (CxxCxxCC family)